MRILTTSDEADRDLENSGRGQRVSRPTDAQCIACGERNGPSRSLGCGCSYCVPCLRRCLRTGLRNEEAWPPRCCSPLIESAVRWAAGGSASHSRLWRLWLCMRREWGTPAGERVYCHDHTCGTFIPQELADPGQCPTCLRSTCRSCRGEAHPGTCQNTENEAMLDLMDIHGFSSCGHCGTVVELHDGCNHITWVFPSSLSSFLPVSVRREG